MKAVITVTGRDSVGIIAGVSALCASAKANIVDITQSVSSGYFAMIMIVGIDSLNTGFSDFSDRLTEYGKANGLVVTAVHEDIFNTMHHI